jgi:hypothetical protein
MFERFTRRWRRLRHRQPPQPMPTATSAPPATDAAPAPSPPPESATSSSAPAVQAMPQSNAPATQTDAAGAGDLAQRVAERLSEDEALRGSLTDAGFGPLLDWATNIVTAAAHRTSASGAANADTLSDAARNLLRALVQAAESGDASSVHDAFSQPLFTAEESSTLRGALADLPAQGDADARAKGLAQALANHVPGAAQ